jgi:hypothetical protein
LLADLGVLQMLVRQILVVPLFVSMVLISSVIGDQLRYYQENGVTYCETRRTVQRPVSETTMQPTTRTVYKEQCYTEMKDVANVCWTPVTTYRTETHWVGILNPFVEPALETEFIPQTCWQQRTEVVKKVPVTCRRMVPEVQQVQVPVTTQKLVLEDYVVNRVAITGPIQQTAPQMIPQPYPTPAQSYAGQPASIYGSGPIGGIARLNQDPPRYGTGTSGTSSFTR